MPDPRIQGPAPASHPDLVVDEAQIEGSLARRDAERVLSDVRHGHCDVPQVESALVRLEDARSALRARGDQALELDAPIRELRASLPAVQRDSIVQQAPLKRTSSARSQGPIPRAQTREAARVMERRGPTAAAEVFFQRSDAAALRRLGRVSPERLEGQLRGAGLDADQAHQLREAIEYRAGFAFHDLVKAELSQKLQSAQGGFAEAARGEERAFRNAAEKTFGPTGEALLERFAIAGADISELRALRTDVAAGRLTRTEAMERSETALRAALSHTAEHIGEAAETLRGFQFMNALNSELYRDFPEFAERVGRRLGMDPGTVMSGEQGVDLLAGAKRAARQFGYGSRDPVVHEQGDSVLSRAVREAVTHNQAHHDDQVAGADRIGTLGSRIPGAAVPSWIYNRIVSGLELAADLDRNDTRTGAAAAGLLDASRETPSDELLFEGINEELAEASQDALKKALRRLANTRP